ncbi:MAG: MoaD/ThiS family protein [Nanoarchaeota archaeon]
MKIYIEAENREIEYDVKDKIKISEILEDLKISRSSVLIAKNDSVCLEEEFVTNGDCIKILSVVSGG